MIFPRPARLLFLGAVVATVCAGLSAPALAVDAAAAERLARQNDCFKCHAIDKRKDGPPYREVAAKYRGNEEAEAKLFHHVTSGRMVKFPDGHEEDHKILKVPEEDIRNLIAWILSLPGN